ncbi:MAG: excinuclease ABC subunit UvrA [Candidatus Cryptobacteroides sp.]|nr:excinuclease ABC subunit UvrA [Bacteroidales bacterium]MDY2860361.1 excinuclease ABC subunit UvrA [Candidatus Cryptobacteroides sp.]MDY3226322.1 excinuclease ABC subunit UvrA [Candidatus Cryptobacteroides sp.]MDY5443587.1 excinuclease ABC subunit UvrA [Candidatus Cryptobacteroides sp.]
MEAGENISIRGARVNNLKNISITIPRNRFTVITGVSGSGKSSLAFDTLFAEGQRRFAESLSSYARQFLGRMSKPDVDAIEGIPPAIAIEQKVNVRNPRSTVATVTEIYDYLRIIFARIGRTFSPISGEEVKCHGSNDVMAFLSSASGPFAAYLLADLRWDAREDKVELLLALKEKGYSRLYSAANGTLRIDDVMADSEGDSFPEGLMLMVDRVKIDGEMDADLRTRLLSSISACFSEGLGKMYVVRDAGSRPEMREFNNRFEADGMTFREPDEYMFSFNSPLGACPVCGGLGKVIGISEDLVIPDKALSIYDGAIACWRGEKMGWFREHLINVAGRYGIPVFEPYCNLSDEVKSMIWEGRKAETEEDSLIGLNEFFKWVESNKYKIQYKYLLSRFSGRTVCGECKGSRLRKDALYVKVGGKNIHELLKMTAGELLDFFRTLELTEYETSIVRKAVDEVVSRLQYVADVGLSYLTLDRACSTLSGGESQRISLVTALGSSLVGSMYILDEPSIGLHPRDTDRLIGVLKRLRDIGNTVVVVEHDEEIIKAADLLIDMGPLAGIDGGEVVFKGVASEASPEDVSRSLTLQYLTGARQRISREKRSWNYSVNVEGAMEHNLKGIDVSFPLGVLTVVSGVSGSGKSSLVGDILYPALFRRLNETGQQPGAFRKLSGNIDRISAVEYVDQNPIGRSSRSNAVTYLKVYDDIRKLFSEQQFARMNGFTPSFFSFNQDGGRCSECQGEGYVHIGMQFMADVTMLCEACGGKRFKPEILEVRYKGKNIDDVLNMSVEEAMDFFSSQPEPAARTIAAKLQPLADVGLSYIKLGQSSSTLSGGESQRIKLAYFLSMTDSTAKKIMFIFDEPTTGLHFHDVEKLVKAFDSLLDRGHTVVVVEHNLDVIRCADWLIELGPGAGDRGGSLVFAGTPEELARKKDTATSAYL